MTITGGSESYLSPINALPELFQVIMIFVHSDLFLASGLRSRSQQLKVTHVPAVWSIHRKREGASAAVIRN